MEKYLIIWCNQNGSLTITNTVNGARTTYYFCTLENAIKQHRKENNLKHLKFTRIYM